MNQTDTDTDAMWQSRPIVQEAHIEGHVEIAFPASNESIVIDEEIARRLGEDIFRVVHGY